MNDFTAVVEISSGPPPLISRFSIPASLQDVASQHQRHMLIALMALCEQGGGEIRINESTFLRLPEKGQLLCVNDRGTGDLILRLVK